MVWASTFQALALHSAGHQVPPVSDHPPEVADNVPFPPPPDPMAVEGVGDEEEEEELVGSPSS